MPMYRACLQRFGAGVGCFVLPSALLLALLLARSPHSGNNSNLLCRGEHPVSLLIKIASRHGPMALLRGLRNEVLSITQSYPRAAFTHLSNAATNGMCSKCFREEQASQDKAKAALAASAEAQHAPVVEAPAPVPAAAAAPTAAIEIARASTPTAEEGSSSAPVATVANAASPSSPCKPNRCVCTWAWPTCFGLTTAPSQQLAQGERLLS
jgi:hypothetical protein